VAVLTWALPAVIAQEEDAERGQRGLAQRVAALEQLLTHFSREGKEIFITGAKPAPRQWPGQHGLYGRRG
jgi:hypothetical protein